ncbi:MAG: hypothetical protein MJZ60_06560 [Bacteroidaceae bacterium]|nr:hypothetical protein [Bacteroidaceae bacterium]
MYSLTYFYNGEQKTDSLFFQEWFENMLGEVPNELLLHHVGVYIINKLRQNNLFSEGVLPQNIIVKDNSGEIICKQETQEIKQKIFK